ncbi:MAG TPA: alpha/beta hydrolase [candidate division Zixibacteria bacterium]|nr:alpha/beta hydrolase [candidate division Zixibacteria bacterium]
MFDFFTPTHPFGGQTLRLVAQAQQGGGDVFEIARTVARIEPGDKEGWEREWLARARATEARGRAALAAGHRRTAAEHLFRANQYYRMSDVFLTAERESDRAERFRKAQECFRAAAGLQRPPIEVIAVRCGSEEYDGYFCHPRDPAPGKWPAVLFIGGADSYAEEIYFGARPMIERGWAVLLVDTPGRGSSIYLKGIKTRPDYEVPGKACIDYLVSRPEVDPARIALMGISMAGYYAPRIAAHDTRVKALVAWSGCYSILEDLYDFCEHLQPTVRRLLGGVGHDEAREQLSAFTMKGIARNITCPTLISHGGEDRLMSVEGAKRLFEEIGARDKTLRIYGASDPAGRIHCSHDYWAENVPFMLDWLEERL